ncbi:MAG: hypothetical protein MR841_08650 [Lactobacillus johnsonii]|nr:hypothetical protein [Lactobacillus johnsonii]
MAKLVWDEAGKHIYETGVSKGVLYVMSDTPGTYGKGVAWNGLSSVSESPTGAEVSAIYADNIKYLNLMSREEFEGSIEAYTYPDEFMACDGSASPEDANGFVIGQQDRKTFAFCYQTKVGNDLNPEAGYKIHIIYGALASPSERSYETVNDSPEAMTFSWDITTTPVAVTGFKPTAHVELDSTKIEKTKLAKIEAKLYGTDEPSGEPTLLMPDEIIGMLKAAA